MRLLTKPLTLAPLFVGALLLATIAAAREPAPEASSGRIEKPAVTAAHQMVVAAHPLAATAGDAILDAGGSALDAAIATQMVLGLVEPQSSGIGGGGFLLHWSAATRDLDAYDGRETAPASAQPDRFLGPDGNPLPFFEAVIGGMSIGVPGLVDMLELAHRKHGRLPWKDLFEPAIRLSEHGFPISPRLHSLLAADRYLARNEAAQLYFYEPDGQPKPVGTILRNPALAASLRLIAEHGSQALHSGPLAEQIVSAAQSAVPPSDLNRKDLADYRAVEREPLCRPYRYWTVCGMPPPSSGGVAVLQMLGMLETFDLPALLPTSVEAAHLVAEAGKLAFADRQRYVADPDRVAVPVTNLLDPEYLRMRAGLIHPTRASGRTDPGDLPEKHGLADGITPEMPSTTHLSIVDRHGNAVALTSSIENAFGARLMVGGFLLNNQLTDFSFVPEIAGSPVANRVEGGKRPRSAMAPTMAFDADGRLRLVTGSPGGSRIINYVAGNVIAILDWNMSPQAAVSLPHVLNRNGPTEIEAGPEANKLISGLSALGHELAIVETTSGLHTIFIDEEGTLHGGADPRREGGAVGN